MKQYRYMRAFLLMFFTLLFVSIGCIAIDSPMTAYAKTITVNKSDNETAKKVHNYIYKGKALTLKVKGNGADSNKKIKSLVKKVGATNQYDIIFHYTKGTQSKGYCNYTVSKENAQLYMYTVKLMSKEYKSLVKRMKKGNYYENELQDIKTYPNVRERKLHVIYDNLIREVLRVYTGEDIDIPCTGYDEPTTVSVMDDQSIFYWDEKVKLYKEIKDEDGWVVERRVYSYQEFLEKNNVNWLLKKAQIYWLTDQQKIILNTPFYKLSDAMKIYAIDNTGIFICYFGNVKYDFNKRTTTSGSKGMKHLYKGTASGVCEQYAEYECLLWEQLGITHYKNSSYKISHAWTVVKVKNSKGKILWVPFDYGIGPSEGLAVNEKQYKYINTEAKRYKLYLAGIKGAPNKRNWKWSDFN